MGFFKYSTTIPMTQFDFCRTLGILKGQIEDKKIGAQNHESTICTSKAEKNLFTLLIHQIEP